MTTKISEALVERAIEMMRDGMPRTYKQMAEALCVSPMPGHKVAETLHARRQIYVVGYQRCARNGALSPMYALGNEPDVVCHEYEQQRRKNRECQLRSKAGAPSRNWFDCALFGDAPALTAPTKWKGRIIRQLMGINEDEEQAA